jgi:hypothetical protein
MDLDPTVCHVTAGRSRWTVVSFDGVAADNQYPPKASVHLTVRKAGNGTGTVRGDRISCGNRCSADVAFGDRDVLTAEASNGSRFVQWRRACGERPRCPLTYGPTSRVTAVFALAAGTAVVNPPTAAKLRVTLHRIRVTRKGRRYRIVVPMHLNLAATVTARLTTRRGRRVAAHKWTLKAGNRTLGFRVAARRGRYRLSLKIASNDGQVKRITRSLRLR